MIVHSAKLVLLHPCRTGGTSLEHAIAAKVGQRLLNHGNDASEKADVEHWGARSGIPMPQCLPPPFHPIPEGYSVFLPVRCPYKRAASMLSFLGMNNMDDLFRHCTASGLEHFPLPQHRYWTWQAEIIKVCDGADLGPVEDALGVRLEKLNASGQRGLTPRDREIVREVYYRDFTMFGFDLLER